MATLIVTNTNDAGAGSLRAAVTAANASVGVADTIVFAGGLAGQTITLTSGQLSLTDGVTIDGDTNGDNKADITISGNNTSRIFHISASSDSFALQSLTLNSGNAGSYAGGAIFSDSFAATLSISDSTIAYNKAKYGGGIASATTTFITNSLITDNTVTNSGGGISQSVRPLTLVNSTITANSANSYGGGIGGNSSTVNIINSTITNNHAAVTSSTNSTAGGGIGIAQFNGPAVVNVTNSIIAGNTSGISFTNSDSSNTITTADHSVFGSVVTITTNTLSLANVSAADIGLGTLGNHGGTTNTFDIVSPTSVLINAGSNTAAAGTSTDANGNVRISGGTVDIGATEYNILTVTNLNDTGAGSLRDAIDQANAKIGADHIVFAAGLSGTIHTASTLVLTNDVTINGDTTGEGDPDIVIGSDGTMHLGLQVNAGTVVDLASLGLNGFTTLSGASAIENHGILTITHSNITNNTVTGGGTQLGLSGETIFSDNSLRVRQSVLSGNHQTGQNAAGVSGIYGEVVNGNVGGNAASILFSGIGTHYFFGSAIINETSVGGAGSNGANTFAYNPTSGGNGGNGGRAVAGILGFNGGSSTSFGINGVNTVTGGAVGSGGMGSVGNGYGAAGQNGVIGATSIGVLVVNSNGGFTNPGATAGDQNANTLTGIGYGLGGNDTMYTDGVYGVLDGGSGHDTLFGILKNSFLVRGGLGNDLLRLSDLAPLEGGSTWDGGFGADTLDLSLDHFLNSSGVTLNLATGANSLNMIVKSIENTVGTSTGNDTLTGSAGNNVIQGLGGFDILDGGAGSDTLDYSEKTGAVTLALNGATAVFQQLNGVNEDVISNFENIIGGSGIDTLTGDAKDNLLRGGAGADTLNGGTNTVVGDTLSYEGSVAFVVVNLALNSASGGDATGDIISNFENVTGSSFNDQLFGGTGADALKGGAGDDVLAGGAGADSLDGGAGTSDTADYRLSTGSNIAVNLLLDTATGGHAAGDTLDGIENLFGSLIQRDILIGDNGSNILKGFGGIDSLQGGDGDDFIEGGADADAINGGAGVNDWASYRDSNTGQVSINLLMATHSGGDAQGDTLFFIENLEGSLTRRDILIGNIVANRIIGNGGIDTIQGGDGNDFIDGGTGGDSLNAGAGIDTLSYEKSTAEVTIDLNVALQVSKGDANGDSLFFFENVNGTDFADNIKGNYQSNRLVGGLGADTLNGGTGSDYLTGGADADTFRFTGLSFGADTILDWQDGTDHISIAPELESSFAGLTFTGNGTNNVIVKGFNGTGSAIIVHADAAFTLDAGDFIFV